MKIYLASKSPRRRELLQQIGVAHEVLPIDIDETVAEGESPQLLVQRLAQAKAAAGAQWLQQQRYPHLPVLAADTVVVLDQLILGKPESPAAAAAMLAQLAGRSHQVHTGVALAYAGQVLTASSCTQVRFAAMSAEDIAAYVATGEPLDKAGAYGIQGQAARFIVSIDGSYTGVVGLPLHETALLLAQLGLGLSHARVGSDWKGEA